MKNLFTLGILCSALSSPCLAQPTATVLSVTDGDTFRVKQGDLLFPVRMACIDAPEKAQEHGKLSTTRLKELLPLGQVVQLRQIARDRYGRIIAEVTVQDRLLNMDLVQEGNAVVYRQYLSGCDANRYLKSEIEARGKRAGIWSLENPVMPWDYRLRKR